jgi:tetratricopeptide (TPR) repeat protein
VRLEEGELSEIDGQLRMTFDDPPGPPPVQMRLIPGPRTAADWHEQGIEQEKSGLLAEAEHSYRQALMVGGSDAQTCFDLAALLASRGRKEQAVERYRQTIELDPNRFDAWNNLGILLTELNDSESAVEAFREALRINPHDALAHYNLADTLDALGQRDAALPHWQKFLAAHAGEDSHTAYARGRLKSS